MSEPEARGPREHERRVARAYDSRILSIAALASASARSFSTWPLWPFTQAQCTLCGLAAASRRCHSSMFLTGFLSPVRQPFFFQPWIHLVAPSSTYLLSV